MRSLGLHRGTINPPHLPLLAVNPNDPFWFPIESYQNQVAILDGRVEGEVPLQVILFPFPHGLNERGDGAFGRCVLENFVSTIPCPRPRFTKSVCHLENDHIMEWVGIWKLQGLPKTCVYLV
ncbi:hypothetical protein CEP51_014892 [Fusarium floridanum]|uniref:Uncharacterized protein n=1 Tax=Fusarium floridanum TaxID=1325733 RepID=A0A428PK82_9HYPO|nr:hypothetical protein CEP51_014892 [Fusarium floridanum]